MSKADSERIATFLEDNGYKQQEDWSQADLIILTTCGVRQSAEDRAYGLVGRICKLNPKARIVIAGCLAKRKDVQKRLAGKVDLFMPIDELPNLLKLLKNCRSGNLLGNDNLKKISAGEYLTIRPKHESSFSAYVPIGNGCNNFCSYCVVPYARGPEVYRPADDIITEVKDLIGEGYKEIILIAQNVNSYQSGQINSPKLLGELAALPGNFWLRFFSSHPKDLSAELISVLASSDKICQHLHVAVQSGDDEILETMNRKYTVAHFRSLIEKIRQTKPGIVITTDAIVGFPGETKKQFLNTVKLFKDMNFDMAYISIYSPRPGTVSWNMKDDVSREEKKHREKVLLDILETNSKNNNNGYIGKELTVLVEGINKRGKYYGKNSGFKTIRFIVPVELSQEDIVGNFVKVKINKIVGNNLEGELIK
jgi:tRNA-2-methylthio-N6-dimethylallyladenosine synthase